MKYSTPELVVLGTAPVLVQGVKVGEEDHPGSDTSRPPMGFAAGLDLAD